MKGKRILVIDDDIASVNFAKKNLTKNNYEVVIATDPMNSLKMVSQHNPNLIIVDIKIAKMDGYGLIRKLKNDNSTQDIPIIIVTSPASMDDMYKVEGISDYILKPYNDQDFQLRITRMLANRDEKSAKKRILIVEDEEEMANFLKMRLEAHNFDVLVTYDGKEGLDKAREEIPDLIILDLMLPKMDGYKVCEFLKGDDKFKEIPIIMLTAKAKEMYEQIGREVGADAYIPKPFEAEVMLSTIQRLIH
jgi:DNA-binding response OmpR family regulator